jgi:lipoprotein-anchoring transpeptidase ErfK/SrfK
MVDYDSILARAVATLNLDTNQQLRHALYDRARKALVDKLRANDPTLSHADLRAESAALEAAILRVEVDAIRRTTPPAPSPIPAYDTYEAPVEEYQDMPPLKDAQTRTRIFVGAFGTLIILVAGAAAYSYGTRILSGASSILNPRIKKVAEEPALNTNYVYLRQLVYYRTNQPVGTIVVDKSHTFLYVVRPNVSALRYTIGVGPECTSLAGFFHIVRKDDGPGGNLPLQQSAVAVNNSTKSPTSARALYLNENYRIHGTNAPSTIIQHVQDGCIRLVDDDFTYLYAGTPLESRVVVLD